MSIIFLKGRGRNSTAKGCGTIYIPGQSDAYMVGGTLFNMHYVPGGLTFPTDTVANTFRDDTTATVANSYWIAQTAVTYQLWSKVFAWAISHGYTFANPGRPGGYTDDYGDTLRTFSPGRHNDPATTINWRDAIIWCNALTEYYNGENGNNLGCVYLNLDSIPIRDSKNNNAICDRLTSDESSANGFRLPSSREWELAARYQNRTEWTPDNHVSGDTTGYCYPRDAGRSKTFIKYAWYLGNSNIPGLDLFSTRPVGKKTANALGLYDLCGNVWEWCFNIDGNSLRLIRGGSWFDGADCIRLGFVSRENPSSTDCNLGFRIVRTGREM